MGNSLSLSLEFQNGVNLGRLHWTICYNLREFCSFGIEFETSFSLLSLENKVGVILKIRKLLRISSSPILVGTCYYPSIYVSVNLSPLVGGIDLQ